jgi:hypothetical protein
MMQKSNLVRTDRLSSGAVRQLSWRSPRWLYQALKMISIRQRSR